VGLCHPLHGQGVVSHSPGCLGGFGMLAGHLVESTGTCQVHAPCRFWAGRMCGRDLAVAAPRLQAISCFHLCWLATRRLAAVLLLLMCMPLVASGLDGWCYVLFGWDFAVADPHLQPTAVIGTLPHVHHPTPGPCCLPVTACRRVPAAPPLPRCLQRCQWPAA
jgi:hypothetical protein